MVINFNTDAENASQSLTDRHRKRQTRLVTQNSSHMQTAMTVRTWWSQGRTARDTYSPVDRRSQFTLLVRHRRV